MRLTIIITFTKYDLTNCYKFNLQISCVNKNSNEAQSFPIIINEPINKTADFQNPSSINFSLMRFCLRP